MCQATVWHFVDKIRAGNMKTSKETWTWTWTENRERKKEGKKERMKEREGRRI